MGLHGIMSSLYRIMGVLGGIRGASMGLVWNYGGFYEILWDLVMIGSLHGIIWDYIHFIWDNGSIGWD